MIKDQWRNRKRYEGMSEKIEEVLRLLESGRLPTPEEPVWKYPEKGITIMYKKYETKELGDEAEAHSLHMDIHFCIRGSEVIYYSNVDFTEASGSYEAEDDCQYFEGGEERLILHEGEFVVFYPEDVHKPGGMYKDNNFVEKIVIKIAL